jgi:hypothetical protein
MFAYTFEEADYAYRAARRTIAQRMEVSEEALHAAEGTNKLLRATNKAYEELLTDIGQWRMEMTRLQQLNADVVQACRKLPTSACKALPEASEDFLKRYPGWRAGLNDLRRLSAAGNHAEFDALAKTWFDRLVYKLREKQGQALFFASEAYQDEATILHVVNDLQATGRAKLITFEKLSGGARSSKVLAGIDQTSRGALNSMMENLANLRKELGHADNASMAAAKGGKYFIRVLDAAHEAGIDIVNVVGQDLVKQTIGADALRANASKVSEFLKASGTSDQAFVKALAVADERLGIEMVRHKDITEMAARVRGLFDDVPGAAEATKKAAAIGERVR